MKWLVQLFYTGRYCFDSSAETTPWWTLSEAWSIQSSIMLWIASSHFSNSSFTVEGSWPVGQVRADEKKSGKARADEQINTITCMRSRGHTEHKIRLLA